jgi:cyclic pyranopterin monophosphate synthase
VGFIYLGEKIFPVLVGGQLKKGDALATARLAAIMAAKNTPNLIPLCHGIPLSGIDVDFSPHPDRLAIEIKVTVRSRAQTGVEMEALTGVATAALTIYDMCKAVDKNMTINDIHLVEKSGGKSGDYHYCPKK